MIWGFSSNSEQGQFAPWVHLFEGFEGKCKGLRVCPQIVLCLLCLRPVRIGNSPEELIPGQSDNDAEPKMVHLSILKRGRVSLSLHIFLHLAMLRTFPVICVSEDKKKLKLKTKTKVNNKKWLRDSVCCSWVCCFYHTLHLWDDSLSFYLLPDEQKPLQVQTDKEIRGRSTTIRAHAQP